MHMKDMGNYFSQLYDIRILLQFIYCTHVIADWIIAGEYLITVKSSTQVSTSLDTVKYMSCQLVCRLSFARGGGEGGDLVKMTV